MYMCVFLFKVKKLSDSFKLEICKYLYANINMQIIIIILSYLVNLFYETAPWLPRLVYCLILVDFILSK